MRNEDILALTPRSAAAPAQAKPRRTKEQSLAKVDKMRRGKHRHGEDAKDIAGDEEEQDRQFVVALSRGLRVLSACKAKDPTLGNKELAERTGIPAATISRLTHTLTKMGYLHFDARTETYDLGGSALTLGHTALARISLRRVALPLMQELAQRANANVGLGIRDRSMMLYAETCEGSGLIGLRLFPGSRISMATSAMGRAYISALGNDEREELLKELAPQYGSEWPTIRHGIDQAMREVAQQGFCLSLRDWQKEIHGVAVPLVDPVRGTVYALNLGGPAYLLSEAFMRNECGPWLREVRDKINMVFATE